MREERWQEPDGCSVDTQKAAHAIDVFSAGTQPGDSLNEESRKSVEAVGASFDGEYPKPIDPDLLRSVDRVVIVGGSAQVDQVEGMRGSVETWDIAEPSLRGIEGKERMMLIRDEISKRVDTLIAQLTPHR